MSSTEINANNTNNAQRGPVRRASPRLSGLGHYRRSRSLASASLIPPASAYSPSLSSVSSAGRQSPPLLLSSASSLPPPAQSPPPSSGRRVRAASLGTPPARRLICHSAQTRAAAARALEINDALVYLEGPAVYACQQCRTHLTTHDDIISKSFHGRRGRAFLFDKVVNITTGPAEDRLLITGLHSVCDIFCQRCRALVGWTYQRAYEPSQKYKEGKFILEKINLFLEAPVTYQVDVPAGERVDRWRNHARLRREDSEEAASVTSLQSSSSNTTTAMVYEYAP